VLIRKFETNLARVFAPKRQKIILDVCNDQRRLEQMPVNAFTDLLAT
jgi:2-methylcitrate dehydratase PrpD